MRTSGLVLFACSGLLLSGGAILGGSTSWSLLRMTYYFWTTDLGLELGCSVMFLCGSLLCLPACWLSTLVPYHPKSLSLLTTLMCIVTAAMLMLGMGLSSIVGLSRAIRDSSALNSSMLRAMSHDTIDPVVRGSFSTMQIELKCCGVTSYNDWYHHRHNQNLPPSCCGRISNGKHGEQCLVPLYPTGCLRPALNELKNFANSVSVLGSAIAFIMAVTLFAAAYTLASSVVERNEARILKSVPQPIRIACLASHQLPQLYPSSAYQAPSPQAPTTQPNAPKASM